MNAERKRGFFAIFLLVAFLGSMSQGVIALTKVTLGSGLDPAEVQTLWIRVAIACTLGLLAGGALVRGIVKPAPPADPGR